MNNVYRKLIHKSFCIIYTETNQIFNHKANQLKMINFMNSCSFEIIVCFISLKLENTFYPHEISNNKFFEWFNILISKGNIKAVCVCAHLKWNAKYGYIERFSVWSWSKAFVAKYIIVLDALVPNYFEQAYLPVSFISSHFRIDIIAI